MYEKLPEELKRSGLFCRWKLELSSKGKPTKMPYAMSGAKARSTVKADFANFRLVVANLDGFDGIGLGIFDGFNAIDIDDCVADGKMSEMAQAVVDTMNSYTEVSPSGTGIRIIFKAKDLTFDRKRYYINNQKAHLEVYIAGATNKYVTLTGNALNDLGVEERSEEIKQVLEQFMVRPEVKEEQAKVKATGSYLTDESVVAKAMASKQGAKFSALWNGEVPDGKSPSEADIALANMLAFWCGGDIEQMDRLFRASGLMRNKWDENRGDKTYGRLTLEKAVAQTNDFYTPLPHSSPADDFDVVMEKLEQLRPEANPRYVWDDLGSGRLFADIYCSIARYVPERKCWYTYDGKRWVQDVGSMLTIELCKDLADRLWIYACGIKDERLRGSYKEFVGKWQKRYRRNIILQDAQSVYPIAMRMFDTDLYLLNCENGTVDLRTMEFREHDANDLITKITPAEYKPSATCERFDIFIEEIMSGDTDKARFLQKILGYAVSGETRYECMYILYGATTRNGKGSLMESVLKVMGDYGRAVRPETIALKSNANSQGPSEDIARLMGIRFVNISEPDKSLVLNAAQVKSLTGNDALNARFLHENSFDFRPQCKIFVSTNHLPRITDNTLFSSGRMVVVPFDRHFDESEQDKTLKEQFALP